MKVFIGAGEASGDLLGGKLITELRLRHPDIKLIGIGGLIMQKAGLTASLFPMDDLSLMGFFEVLPKLFRILRHLRKAKKFILQEKPDVVITIDAPDFYLHLLKVLKKKSTIPTIHYNAPAVWASRPGRAKKIAAFVDHLLCLFPFDPPYFTPHGMKATFIGHPLMKIEKKSPSLELSQRGTPITVLFGSRTQEIQRLKEPFIHACKLLQHDFPDLHLLIPTFDKFKGHLKGLLDTSGVPYTFVDQSQKYAAFKASKAALAASGTVALELAKAELPFVVGYKLSPLTYLIAKRVITTPYVCLVNVILGKSLIAECLQDECNGENLYKAMKTLLDTSQGDYVLLKEQLRIAYGHLKSPGISPSHMACDIIDSYVQGKPNLF